MLAIAVSGMLSFAVDVPGAATPAIPAVEDLISGTSWKADGLPGTGQAGQAGLDYWQWPLSDVDGRTALLFVGTTSRPQRIFTWSGELGFLGEGYLVSSSHVSTVAVGRQIGRVTMVEIRHDGDVEELAYATLRPDGIRAAASDSLVALSWDALANRGAPYFAVRVAVPAGSTPATNAQKAVLLLTAVLSSLKQSQNLKVA